MRVKAGPAGGVGHFHEQPCLCVASVPSLRAGEVSGLGIWRVAYRSIVALMRADKTIP